MTAALPPPTLADLAAQHDDALDLIGAALALARLHGPGWDEARVVAALTTLVATAGDRLAGRGSAADQADALACVLVGDGGLRVAKDDFAGAELPTLMIEGHGPAEALALVWLWVASRTGVACECLAFPHHPLVRIGDSTGGRVIVDCGSGLTLNAASLRGLHKTDAGPAAELEPGYFLPQTNRDVLLRWRHWLKLRALRLGDLAQALALVESAQKLAPLRVGLWREIGLMRLRLNDVAGAAAALEQFVQRAESGPTRLRTQQLLAEIRARL